MNNSNTNSDINISLQLEENELYYYLLEDIYSIIDNNISTDNGIKISKPEVNYDKSRKSIWSNFYQICKQINRASLDDMNHILKFFKKEYSVAPNLNKDNHFLIKGRYNTQIIGNTLKRYIKIFLKCEPCKGMNTTVEKRQNRLTYLVCHNEKCKYEKVTDYEL